jgi:hypothetical protein
MFEFCKNIILPQEEIGLLDKMQLRFSCPKLPCVNNNIDRKLDAQPGSQAPGFFYTFISWGKIWNFFQLGKMLNG